MRLFLIFHENAGETKFVKFIKRLPTWREDTEL